MLRLTILASLIFNFTPTLPAQVTSGEIIGTIQDATGAVVVDAKVTVRSLDTNASRDVTSGSDGRFRVPLLQPGSYEVLVEKPGFAKYRQGPIVLRLNQVADLGINLQVSATSDTVVVSSDAPLVNTTNAEIGVNFDARRIQEVPLAPNRNVLNLALNVAGVSQLSSGQSQFASGGSSGTDSNVSFAVNGMRTRSNNFMIDGQDSNDPSVTGLSQGINNPDIVAEFRLITNQFLPEYGRAAGSVVNFITKRGTNRYSGSAFWFYNGNKLNSRSNLDKSARFTSAPWRVNNQFGGTLGGPLSIPKVYSGKNKTFFFASLQRWTDRRIGSGSTIDGAPTEEGRRILQPFANRVTVKALLDFLPPAQTAPTKTVAFTAGGNTFQVPVGKLTGATTQTFDDWQWSGRVDHQFNDKHNIGTRYLYDDSLAGGNGQATPVGLTTTVPTRRQSATAWWTQTLSPTMFGELRTSFTRYAQVSTASDPRSEAIPSIEVNELGLTGFNAATTRTGIGLAVNLPQFRRNNNYQLQYTLGLLRGNHSMKYGIDFRKQDVVSFFVPTIRGRLVYSSLQSLVDDVAQSTQINGPLPGGQTNQYYRFYDYFFFLQDEWRINSRFTLSYGVRYETPGNPFDNLRKLNEPIVQAAGGDPRYRLTPVPPRDKNNWAPRLGFNYRFGKASGPLHWLTGDGNLVLRGGYSRTYDFAFINIGLNVGSAFPFLNSVSLPANTPNSFPALLASVANNRVTGDPNQLVRTQTASDFRSPYGEQFSLQLQRGFGDWAFSLGWVGTKGTALFQTLDGNPVVPGSCGNPCTAANIRRVDPSQGVRRVRANTSSSIYHSLQTSLEKRLSRSFTMGAHFTWSAFIDDASEVFNPAVNGDVAVSQDSFNRRIDRARSTYDRPRRITTTFVYELPMFRAQKGLAGHVLGGWQINGFLTFQSGAPFTPLAGIDPGFRLSGIDGLVGNAIRPDTATNRDIARMNLAEIYAFNTTAPVNNGSRNSLFANLSASNPIGNAGRNILKADGIGNFDFGAFKNVRTFGENQRLQFRAEFFNLTNTRNFGIPESRINSTAFLNQWGTDGGNRRITLGLRYVF